MYMFSLMYTNIHFIALIYIYPNFPNVALSLATQGWRNYIEVQWSATSNLREAIDLATTVPGLVCVFGPKKCPM